MDQHQNQIETFEAFDDCENIGSNPAPDSPIGEIIEAARCSVPPPRWLPFQPGFRVMPKRNQLCRFQVGLPP